MKHLLFVLTIFLFFLQAQEYTYKFQWQRCKIKGVSDELKEVMKSKDYRKIIFSFSKDSQNEDFETIANLPKAVKVEIDYGNQYISDFTPLSKLKNLEYFSAKSLRKSRDRRIDISVLKDNKALKELNLYGTKVEGENALLSLSRLVHLNFYMSYIKDISCIKGMPNLEVLDLYACKDVVDYSPLKYAPKLKHLNLYMHTAPRNQFAYLKFLVSLESIWLHFTKITNLNFLKNCKKMRKIKARWCRQLQDISAVKNMPDLEELSVGDSKVTDISALENLKKLRYVGLSRTKIDSISALKNCENLRRLDISNTEVDDLSPLKNCANLNSINISETRIQDLEVLLNMKKLWQLQVSKDFPDDEIQTLKKKFPKLRVYYR